MTYRDLTLTLAHHRHSPSMAKLDHVVPSFETTITHSQVCSFHTTSLSDLHSIYTGLPCDSDGVSLCPGAPPKPPEPQSPDDWYPYKSRLEFELADFLYIQNQMPAEQIDTLLDIWAELLTTVGGTPLFQSHKDLYETIDHTRIGDVKWKSFSVKYVSTHDRGDAAPWMQDTYDIWFRCPHQTMHNMFGNPEFASQMEFRPYREYDTHTGQWRFQNFMSADWALDQAV